MSYLSNQQYLIKTKEHLSYLFYINEEKQLHYRLFNSKAIFMKDITLDNNQIIEFSAIIDTQDKIHIIYIDSCGQLKYFIGKNNDWDSKDLSKLDFTSNNYKHLSLHIYKDITHLLYVKTNLLNTMVSSIEHTYWDKKSIKKITAISYMPGKYISPLNVSLDNSGNIHIVYKGIYKNNYQLFYTKFNQSSKKWGSNEILTDLDDDHSHPFILIDKYDHFHLCWCTVEDNNFVLKYKRRANISNTKSKWSEIKSLSDHNSNSISPVIIQDGEKIKILSKQNGTIFLISSDDYGLNWSSTSKENSYKIQNTLLFKYFSNDSGEKNQYKLSYIYGEISDSIIALGIDIYPRSHPADLHNKTVPKPKEVIGKDQENTNHKPDIQQDNPMHEKIQNIVGDIEGYINDMELQIKKLEEIRSFLFHSKNHSDVENNLANKDKIENIFILVNNIEKQLFVLEEEKQELIKELNYYNKKIEYFENKLVEFKKQYLTLEEIINKDISHGSSLLEKIINYFK